MKTFARLTAVLFLCLATTTASHAMERRHFQGGGEFRASRPVVTNVATPVYNNYTAPVTAYAGYSAYNGYSGYNSYATPVVNSAPAVVTTGMVGMGLHHHHHHWH